MRAKTAAPLRALLQSFPRRLLGALLIQVLISLANIAAADRARPAHSRGNPQFKRSTAVPSVKARSTSLAGSRTAAAARGHPHRPSGFIFSTVESAQTNRVFQDVRSGVVGARNLRELTLNCPICRNRTRRAALGRIASTPATEIMRHDRTSTPTARTATTVTGFQLCE